MMTRQDRAALMAIRRGDLGPILVGTLAALVLFIARAEGWS